MILALRVVQDHGWVQRPDGVMVWGPTKYWMESQNEDGSWSPLNVVNINENPTEDHPMHEPTGIAGTVLINFDEDNEASDPLNTRHR